MNIFKGNQLDIFLIFKDENLINLKKKCEPFLMEALEIKLNKMFTELNKNCNIYINDLNNQQKILYTENNIKSNYFSFYFYFWKTIRNFI